MRTQWLWVVAWALGLGNSGCCTHNKCGTPQTEITILDEKGERFVGDVSIEEVKEFSFCKEGCTLRVEFQPVLTIQAGHYPAQRLTFEAKSDDCGNAIGQRATLHLSTGDVSTGAQARVEHSDGASCGE